MNTGMNMDKDMDMSKSMHHDHQAASLPMAQLVAILAATFGILLLSLWVTAQFAPIAFSLP